MMPKATAKLESFMCMRRRLRLIHVNGCELAVKGECARALDVDIEQLAAVPVGAFEHDDLIAARPTLESGQVLAAHSFDQDLEPPANEALEFVGRDLID